MMSTHYFYGRQPGRIGINWRNTFDLNVADDDSSGTGTDATYDPTLTYSDVGDFNGDGFDDDLRITTTNVIAQVTETETITSTSFQIDDLSQSSFSLLTQNDALSALAALTTQLEELSQARGKIGASLGRLSVATNALISS